MTVYQAEPIDINDLKTLFEDNWDQRSNGEIPQPEFTVSDAPREDPSLQWGPNNRRAFVNIYIQDVTDTQDGYAYQHVRIRAVVVMDIWTRRETASAGGTGRQYLHDVKQEIRRIIYANKHSLANWQIAKYMGFEEVYEDSGVVRFHGRLRLSLENDGVAAPAELVAEDLFNRSNEELSAGDWTEESGDWEVVGNRAALQDATADAIALFAPSSATLKANHRVQCDLITADSMDAGVVFRHLDSSNFWLAKLIEAAGVKYLRLVRTVGGTAVQMAEAREPGWTDGDRVELAVDLYNACFSVSFNGLPMIQITDASLQANTGYGIYSNADQTTRLDNYMIFESGGMGR